MKKGKELYAIAFASLLFGTTLSSCSGSSDDDNNIVPIIIPANTDEECCNAEETFLAYAFLNNGYVKEIEQLRDTIDGKYELRAYSANGKLHVGYNELFFALTKLSNKGYVRDFSVTGIKPLMTMTAMGMTHSTPTQTEAVLHDAKFPAVRRAWVSFLMSSENGYWELSYTASTNNKSITHEPVKVTVDALADGQAWLKSFKVGTETYYLSLVNPLDLQVGTNTVKAYVSKRGSDKSEPYELAEETFTINIYPTMPDMGNHTSPDNQALTRQADGSYEGTLNLSMTGTWDIHLQVIDAAGNTVAGGEGLSDLYWTVTR